MAQTRGPGAPPWLGGGQQPRTDRRVLEIDERERRALEALLEWAIQYPGQQQEPLRAIYQELA